MNKTFLLIWLISMLILMIYDRCFNKPCLKWDKEAWATNLVFAPIFAIFVCVDLLVECCEELAKVLTKER